MVGSTWNTLKSMYGTEGVAGLYKGFIPRMIHTFPVVMTLAAMTIGG